MTDPETRGDAPVLDQARCILCCACRNACPSNAITIERGRVSLDPARCDGCGACVDACIPGALRSAAVRRYNRRSDAIAPETA